MPDNARVLLPPLIHAHAQACMEIICSCRKTRLYMPGALYGRSGKEVFSMAHHDDRATLYWHLDDNYLGTTKGRHEYGISFSPGKHVLHIVDNKGRTLMYHFEIM